jgi:tripartite-type tricarboxylate transporter receptor subunit TctC
VTPSLYKSLPYDPIKSFEPISLISTSPFLALVKGDSAVNSLAELTALVKSKPGTMSWASSGVGAGPYLSGELFRTRGSLDVVHVPFTGTPPSLNAVIGGHVNYVLADITSLPLIRSGQLKALGVTTAMRASHLPDVPTLSEAGVTGYEANTWQMMVGPARTPEAVVARLNKALGEVMLTAESQSYFTGLGMQPRTSTPAEAAEHIRVEAARWTKIIQGIGVSVD